jgi:hypothetical protein
MYDDSQKKRRQHVCSFRARIPKTVSFEIHVSSSTHGFIGQRNRPTRECLGRRGIRTNILSEYSFRLLLLIFIKTYIDTKIYLNISILE